MWMTAGTGRVMRAFSGNELLFQDGLQCLKVKVLIGYIPGNEHQGVAC